jgi:hypothetical protein
VIVWKAMQTCDIDQVLTLSEAVHPELPESRLTQEQRLAIFPQGCLVLKAGPVVQGYAFAHPIYRNMPPALDRAPHGIDQASDQLYIHDFVVSPTLRGGGYAKKGIKELLLLGNQFATTALISVYRTAEFWGKFGFTPSPSVPADQLVSYGLGAVYMVRNNPSYHGKH